MKSVIAGAACSSGQPTTQAQGAAAVAACSLTLSALRRNLLAIVAGNSLFSDAEQVLINHNAHECTCPVRLALWCRNTRRVAADRDHARTQQTLAGMEQGIARFNARVEAAEQAPAEQAPAEQPTAEPTLTAPAVAYATPAQCDEVFRLACRLSSQEKADALRRLPHLTEPEAAAFIRGLHLRRGCRLRYPVTLRGQVVPVPVAERHFEAARVDYFAHVVTGRVLPRTHQELLWHTGQPVRQLWAN